MVPTHNAKLLSAAVLEQCVRDIRAERDSDDHEAERCVRKGGCDMYMEILGLKMSREQFIEKALGIDKRKKK